MYICVIYLYICICENDIYIYMDGVKARNDADLAINEAATLRWLALFSCIYIYIYMYIYKHLQIYIYIYEFICK